MPACPDTDHDAYRFALYPSTVSRDPNRAVEAHTLVRRIRGLRRPRFVARSMDYLSLGTYRADPVDGRLARAVLRLGDRYLGLAVRRLFRGA